MTGTEDSTFQWQGLWIAAAIGATPRYLSQLVFSIILGQFCEFGRSAPGMAATTRFSALLTAPPTAPGKLLTAPLIQLVAHLGTSRPLRSESMAAAELVLTSTAIKRLEYVALSSMAVGGDERSGWGGGLRW